MPKHNHLSRTDFKQMRGFKRLHGRLFSLAFGMIPGRDTQGAACVVSKKVASKAARRNSVKRRCRAVLSAVLKKMPVPFTVVCVAKQGAAAASFTEIRSDIEGLVARAVSAR
ncbi:MAG TPA: ribonuclease P protein component [Candidatus Paceibacterota bacterium]|nr:ribonuclease P protein component [Candidatus Paceibacterota bacterium]